MDATRRRVLAVFRPGSRADIAKVMAATGLPASSVLWHLRALERQGWLVRCDESRAPKESQRPFRRTYRLADDRRTYRLTTADTYRLTL